MKMLDRALAAFWFMAGSASARAGDYERALQQFNRAARRQEPTLLFKGYRALVLMLLGRRIEAEAEFREIAGAVKPSNPNDEYARLYARMYVAYLDDHLIEADQIEAELQQIECGLGVRELMIPMERPSALAADSLLAAIGIEGSDPMGFRDEGSGAHWMKAVKAYSKGDHLQALNHIDSAEAIRGASPAQKALKAGLLIHLGRIDEADLLFDQAIEELDGAVSPDDRYARLYCEYHRPSADEGEHYRRLKEAQALAPQTAVHLLLPLEGFDPDLVSAHFKNMQAAYDSKLIRLTSGSR